MANYNSLKSTISSNIRQNGTNAITGPVLQSVLNAMVNALGAQYQFVGVASTNTNPGTPDYNIAYLAGPGTYSNFGGITIPDGNIAILRYNGTWVADRLELPGGTTIAWAQIVTSGTKIATITINGTPIDVYAPSGGGGGGGSTITWQQIVTSGTKIATLIIDGNSTDIFVPNPGSTVSVSQYLTSGTRIARISVNGTPTDIYAPSGGGGGDSVQWSQVPIAGTKIATITINGVSTDVYAPAGGASVGDENIYETIFKKNIVSGKNIRETGSVLTDPDRCYLDYLPCFPGATIVYQSETDNSLISAVAFYDKNKAYLSSLTNVGPRGVLYSATVPANAYYVRLCTYISEANTMQYYCKGYVEYLANEIETLNTKVKEIENDVSNYEIVNYMSFAETFQNSKYANDGTIVSDPDQNCTSLVPLDREQDLYCGTSGYAEAVFFDANKDYISKSNIWMYANISKANFPANARYLAFNYYRDSVIGTEGFYAGTRYVLFCTGIYPFEKKLKNSRPQIQIKTTDSQEEIFIKLVKAWYLEDCDVEFENGNYSFSTIFSLMQTKYGWTGAFELPLGGNCRYNLNGSTITGTNVSNTQLVYENTSVFGTHRMGDYNNSFELRNGTIIGVGTIYVIHDECEGGTFAYWHRYDNLRIIYNTGTRTVAASCGIGAGTGLNGAWEIEACYFENNNSQSDNDIFIHGHNQTAASEFRISITDSYFSKKVSLLALSGNSQKGKALLSANSFFGQIVQNTNWTINQTINTFRT